VKVVIVGAGHVGRTLVEALHGEHAFTVIDLDEACLAALSLTGATTAESLGKSLARARARGPARSGRRLSDTRRAAL